MALLFQFKVPPPKSCSHFSHVFAGMKSPKISYRLSNLSNLSLFIGSQCRALGSPIFQVPRTLLGKESISLPFTALLSR